MKKSTILFGLMAVAITVFAQEANQFVFEIGRPSIPELTMTEYRADKSADAVVIYESGDFYFKRIDRERDRNKDYYFSLVKTYKIKIKILKPSGIERAKFAIPVFRESEYMFENFYIQIANVYNYDTITKKIVKATFEDEEWVVRGRNTKENKLNKNYIIKMFTMPDVKVGSIVELEYAIETPFVFSFQWQYQRNIPVMYSKIRYRTVPHLAYNYRLNSDRKFDEFNEELLFLKEDRNNSQREKAFNFGMRNIPAYNKDKNQNKGMLAIDFQLFEQRYNVGDAVDIVKTWKDFSKEILAYNDFGKYIKRTEKEAKKILPTLNLAGKGQFEKMEDIFNYVKTNYNWNGLYGKYVLHQLPDFLKDKNGNAANINLFLIGMLNAAKVPATPVLISPYDNGDVSKLHPFDAIYNYVIVRVNIGNMTYYLDAAGFKQTSELTGFVVKKNSNEFVKIAKIEPNTINNLKPEQEKLDNDGEFTTLLNSLKKVFYFLR